MKNIKLKKIIIGICVFVGVSHLAHAGNIEKKYVYQGDSDAKSICMAIAKNNVNRLNRALKSRKLSRLDNKVHERFTCNDKDLFSFAEDMKAPLVANYLAPKFGYEDNMKSVASIDKL